MSWPMSLLLHFTYPETIWRPVFLMLQNCDPKFVTSYTKTSWKERRIMRRHIFFLVPLPDDFKVYEYGIFYRQERNTLPTVHLLTMLTVVPQGPTMELCKHKGMDGFCSTHQHCEMRLEHVGLEALHCSFRPPLRQVYPIWSSSPGGL